MRVRRIELALVALLFATPAGAAQVLVSDAWMRALPAHLPAAGYFTLKNTGPAAITLNGAETPACAMLMLHKSTEMNGMGSMEDVVGVAVPPGGSVKFAPGGYHLMCTGPSAAIRPGATVAITLHFADGSRTKADFAVKNAQGK